MQLTLISLYYYVCERYNSRLCWEVQRFSPNCNCGIITDEEIITIYLFAYIDEKLNKKLINEHNSQIITPIKDKKGMPIVLKQFDQAFNDLFSTAVSSIRQPIESFLIGYSK